MKVHSDRHIKGVKVPGNESSIELSFPGAKGRGSKGPGNELAGSEKAYMLVGLHVILVFALSNGRECKCKTAKIKGDRHIKGAKVPGNERKRLGTKGPGSELARE